MKVYRDTALDGARSYRGWARWGVGDGQAIELWFLVAPPGDVTGRVKECHESAGAALPSHCLPSIWANRGSKAGSGGWRQCGRWGSTGVLAGEKSRLPGNGTVHRLWAS